VRSGSEVEGGRLRGRGPQWCEVCRSARVPRPARIEPETILPPSCTLNSMLNNEEDTQGAKSLGDTTLVLVMVRVYVAIVQQFFRGGLRG
jgi:hypothetical protein